jgi:hypothetical protein
MRYLEERIFFSTADIQKFTKILKKRMLVILKPVEAHLSFVVANL